MRIELEGVQVDKDVRVAMTVAAALAEREDAAGASPASLAWALTGDARVRAWWGPSVVSAESAFERLTGETKNDSLDLVAVLARASARALRRTGNTTVFSAITERLSKLPWKLRMGVLKKDAEVRPSRADVLYALASVDVLAPHFSGTTTGFYGALDEEEPAVPEGDLDWAKLDRGQTRRVSIVIDDDDATPMAAVVSTLTDAFDFSAARAASTMYRIHLGGSARVTTRSPDEARRALDRCLAVMRTAAPTLRVRCIAETGAPR